MSQDKSFLDCKYTVIIQCSNSIHRRKDKHLSGISGLQDPTRYEPPLSRALNSSDILVPCRGLCDWCPVSSQCRQLPPAYTTHIIISVQFFSTGGFRIAQNVFTNVNLQEWLSKPKTWFVHIIWLRFIFGRLNTFSELGRCYSLTTVQWYPVAYTSSRTPVILTLSPGLAGGKQLIIYCTHFRSTTVFFIYLIGY